MLCPRAESRGEGVFLGAKCGDRVVDEVIVV